MAGSLADFGWVAQQLEAELTSNAYGVYWFLQEGESLVAYVAGQLLFGDLEILRVYTDPAYRGRRLGQELLRAVLDDEDVDVAFLEVRSQYKAAVRLYTAVGFELVSIRKDYYKHPVDDAMNMMWKEE